MAKTTKDIIKILPFEEAFKLRLLNVFDKLSSGVKFEITEMIWDTYDAIYQVKLEQNIQLALLDAADGNAEITPEFYEKIEEQTEKEFANAHVQLGEQVDLSKARESLEQLIQDTDTPQTS